MAYASPCARGLQRGVFTLGNIVEVDETYIGGREANKHKARKLNAGRGTVGKTAVADIRERGGKVTAKPVERTDSATLIPFVEDIERGAKVFTDDAAAYAALPSILNQFAHETVSHGKGEYVRGEAHTTRSKASGRFSSARSTALGTMFRRSTFADMSTRRRSD